MRALGTAAWFAVLSGLVTGWLAVVHAVGAEDMPAAVSLLAAGLVFGLLSLALLRAVKR
ncbi:MAG: hypothetical protein GXP34_11395 [Actinobacteria bacterium]|nr:hypothetical protein [Actinomycetota bacterium]